MVHRFVLKCLHCTATSERSSGVFLPLVIELMILPFSFYYYSLLHFRPTEHEYSFYFIYFSFFFLIDDDDLIRAFPKNGLEKSFLCSVVLSVFG